MTLAGIRSPQRGEHFILQATRVRFFTTECVLNDDGSQTWTWPDEVSLRSGDDPDRPIVVDLAPLLLELFGPNGPGHDAVELWASPTTAVALFTEFYVRTTEQIVVLESEKFVSVRSVVYHGHVFTLHVCEPWWRYPVTLTAEPPHFS